MLGKATKQYLVGNMDVDSPMLILYFSYVSYME